ncbi:LLM class F420-dependent oxidoreductase [Nakamurella sp. YIM 132087]|uniref:LLM class F420-dependent oxidoreductase n=1 Tax=Nakamurella alba TaxID=2665158 RepID=A0A7K1FP99_9ACTN|nr:LLM class F420-dependent oxidoreductase [Nakamurella alba]MTD15976.1 LLM class F420-dependent oxidoreductase [Nakamurella alba]
MTAHLGLTVPLAGESLGELAGIVEAATSSGFTDIWSAEGTGPDAFTPLVAAATLHPGLRYGTAIAGAFIRSPALLTMQAAGLADLVSSHPTGETLVGIGSSSDIMVGQWHGIPFQRPWHRVRDVVRFLRAAMSGDKVDLHTDSFDITGFRLQTVPARPPLLLVAALRRRMLELGGTEADGVILNWLSAGDVAAVKHHVLDSNPDAEIAARLFAIVADDQEQARIAARRQIAAYLNVPVYADFHRWLGRGPALEPMWTAWAAGDRRGALAAIPDAVVDELFLLGTPAQIRAGIDEYVAAGVTSPMLAVTVLSGDRNDVIRSLGPGAA